MSVLYTILFGSLLSSALAARVSPAQAIESDLEADKDAIENIDGMESSACSAGQTYSLDDHGQCHELKESGLGDVASEECCLACDPDAMYGRDDQGRCRTDINKNGVLDRFANSECCECDTNAVYGRDNNGRCRTDVNKNGLLDRFAKDVCCGDQVAYYGAGGKFVYKHPKYGDMSSTKQCKSKKLGTSGDERMSNRNTQDCVACIEEGSTLITHPERCVADEPAAPQKTAGNEEKKATAATPPAAKPVTYRFGTIASVPECNRLTRMNPSMQFRMSEIMYQKQLAAQRQQGKQACIACLQQQKVPAKFAGFCKAV